MWLRDRPRFSLQLLLLGLSLAHHLLILSRENFDYLGQFPPQMDILVIAGKLGWNPSIKKANDGKVAVEETRLSTPHKHITVLAGHSWITYSPRVVKETRKFLKPK